MQSSTLYRAGAIFTASALALSLGTGPASAADSSRQSVGFAPATQSGSNAFQKAGASDSQARVAAAAADVTKITIPNSVLSKKGFNQIYGARVNYTGSGTIKSIKSTVRVNGKASFLYFNANGTVSVPSTAGAGSARIVKSTVSYTDGSSSVDTTQSNAFFLRRALSTNGALKIVRKGKKVTFTATRIRVFRPASGTYVSLGKVKLQYKSGSKWMTKKNITLNSKGKGTYTISTSTKRRYRLFVPTTSTLYGGSTRTSGRI